MSGTLNPLAAGGAPAQASPQPNPLATGTIPPPAPQQGAPPVGDVVAHFAQMDMTPEAVAQGIQRSNYLTAELGRLSGNASVTRKDVVKATADAVGARRIGAEEGIRFISQMPEKPEQVRPWLQQQYHGALVGSVALHAHAHQMVGAASQGAPGGPMPGGGAMAGPGPQAAVAAPQGGAPASYASGGLVTRTESMPASVQTLGQPMYHPLTGQMVPPPSWHNTLPNYEMTDPNFREYGTGDAGRMFSGEVPTAPPPLYPTPGNELPPTADRNTMDPANTRYWRQFPPDFQIPHAAGGPVAMTGPNPAGPDDGYITAKAGEYVLQRAAVARYGKPLLDAINSGRLDPKALRKATKPAGES